MTAIFNDETLAAVAVLISMIVPSAIAMVLGFLTARRNGEDVW